MDDAGNKQMWRITDDTGRVHFGRFYTKSQAVRWCIKVLERNCAGCRRATVEEIRTITD